MLYVDGVEWMGWMGWLSLVVGLLRATSVLIMLFIRIHFVPFIYHVPKFSWICCKLANYYLVFMNVHCKKGFSPLFYQVLLCFSLESVGMNS